MSEVVLSVRVKTLARKNSWLIQPDGRIFVSLISAPIDGEANEELIELCARHYGVSKSRVTIQSGAASSAKRLRVRIG